MEQSLKPIYQGIIDGNKELAAKKVQDGLDEGLGPDFILNEALIPAMTEVGRRYEIGEFYVPEMLLAARAMKASMALIKPILIEKDIKPVGKVVIGTVKGDIHDIGKGLVVTMLEGSGFDVQDLGVDVSPKTFVKTIDSGDVDILAMSALITTTMPMMKTTIEAIKKAGLRESVSIIIGGAPVTEVFAEEIGADASAIDAGQAAKVAKAFVSKP